MERFKKVIKITLMVIALIATIYFGVWICLIQAIMNLFNASSFGGILTNIVKICVGVPESAIIIALLSVSIIDIIGK